jgi:short-subunit dehydrogenase
VKLSDRSVLLTGATGGIGHAIARRLHSAGASLILTGRRTDVLEPLAAELGARSIAVDLSEAEQVHRLIEEAGDVDVLVANAALPASGDIRDYSEEQIDRALDVNLRAPIILAKALGERMAGRGKGHLVFISSLAGKSGQAGSALYSATKFGLRGFGQGLRADLRPEGVGVSVVFPGFITDAGMFADADVQLPRFVGTSTPDDVANAVLRAIEDNKGEVDVAPLGMRAGTKFAGLAPELAARVTRVTGGERISSDLAEGQTPKR